MGGGEGHKDWPATFSSVPHDDTLYNRGDKQALPCKVPCGYPEDRVQMARWLWQGSVRPCQNQSSLAWDWRGTGEKSHAGRILTVPTGSRAQAVTGLSPDLRNHILLSCGCSLGPRRGKHRRNVFQLLKFKGEDGNNSSIL